MDGGPLTRDSNDGGMHGDELSGSVRVVVRTQKDLHGEGKYGPQRLRVGSQKEEAQIKAGVEGAGRALEPVEQRSGDGVAYGRGGVEKCGADAEQRAGDDIGGIVYAQIDAGQTNDEEDEDVDIDARPPRYEKDNGGEREVEDRVVAWKRAPPHQPGLVEPDRRVEVQGRHGEGTRTEGQRCDQAPGGKDGHQTCECAGEDDLPVAVRGFAFTEPGPPEHGGDDSSTEEVVVGHDADQCVERRRSVRELIEEVQDAGIEWIEQDWPPGGFRNENSRYFDAVKGFLIEGRAW